MSRLFSLAAAILIAVGVAWRTSGHSTQHRRRGLNHLSLDPHGFPHSEFCVQALAAGVTLFAFAAAERRKNGALSSSQLLPAAEVAILFRYGNRHRDREAWKQTIGRLSAKKFRKRFKVSRARFNIICNLIAEDVEPDDIGKYMAWVSSKSHISAEVHLAVTLRYLAGSNFSDVEDIYGLEESSIYKCIWKTLKALDRRLQLCDFNPWSLSTCARLAEKMWHRSKFTMAGCIGALDGMAVRICKPKASDTDNPKHYFNRKGFYSMNLQAIADADRCFLWFSLATSGGTHDSLAFRLSNLGQQLTKRGLPPGYWIAGDDAYGITEWLICPYSTQSCRGHPARDHFNFYQSRCRINVECAFGMLTERFGVLRRPLKPSLAKVSLIVSVCLKLHNICVQDGIARHDPLSKDVRPWDIFEPIPQDVVSYVPRDLKKRQKSNLRQKLCDDLAKKGFKRPNKVEKPRRRRGR
eukprot:scaffold34122_cov19-Prasinocladus_malaysianus.AAC.1